jgi:hypothetical protein
MNTLYGIEPVNVNVLEFTSITIGVDGLPIISYYDNTNLDLKVAKCSNALCAPYFRRR